MVQRKWSVHTTFRKKTCLRKVKAHFSDFETLPHCSENSCCINFIKKHHQAAKPQRLPHPVEPAAAAAVVVFLLSSYESLAPLALWHCPAFPLSLSVCLSHTLSLSLFRSRALSFWTMTLRDSCNVRRLSILAGAWKAEAEGRERAFIWDWGRWPPSFPFSFSTSFLSLVSVSARYPPPTNRSQDCTLKKVSCGKRCPPHR